MKGVSAVIATILMLMITIALAGTAYLYISGFFGSSTGVVLSLDPSSSCTSSGGFRVAVRNDGKSVASNVQIDITLPNGNTLPADCNIAVINAGVTGSTTCSVSGGGNGNYGVRAYGGGSTATGIIYCGSQPGNPTTSTTTTSTTTTTGSTSSTTTTTGSTSSTTTTTITGTPTQTIGDTSYHDYDGFGAIYWQQITASSSGTLQSVGVNIASPSGNVMTAIYSDSGSNSPANRLGYSSSAAQSSGWNNLAIPGGVSITVGTKYWLAVESSNHNAYYASTTHGTIYSESYTYGTFPSTASGAFTSNYVITNMGMTYS